MYTLRVKGVPGGRQNRSAFEDLFPRFITKTFVIVTFKCGYAAVVFHEQHQAEKLDRFIHKHNIMGFTTCRIIDGFFEYDERKNIDIVLKPIANRIVEFDTVDPCLKTHLSCTICMDLLTNPYSTECGHTFCKSCILNWTRSTANSCPVCRKPVKKIMIATIIQNIIDDMQVYCTHKQNGCSWKGKKSEIQKHLNVCSFRTVKCTLCKKQGGINSFDDHGNQCTGIIISTCKNVVRGCTYRGTKKELKKHKRVCTHDSIASTRKIVHSIGFITLNK